MKKIILILSVLFLAACTDDESSGSSSDNYDRSVLLTNWADNIILPSYANYVEKIEVLATASAQFVTEASLANLNALRQAYQDAYIAFQQISMFEIGPAESLDFRSYTNTYPTNATAIDGIVKAHEYPNLELPSTRDKQGFPALDFLLYGIETSDQAIVNAYATGEFKETYTYYLNAVVERIQTLGNEVNNQWNNSFRDEFVNNTSSSSTGAVDKMANDFIIHYEKFVRSGKVGIPAGVFSGNIEPQTVESYYNPEFSKTLLLTALTASKDFFEGKHTLHNMQGESFKSYLDFLNTIKEGEDLSALIVNQYQESLQLANQLNDNLVFEVENNNSKMLETYESMQKNVVFLKLDMLQALSISVDYVDTDGD
ncbi:imelysin family protein [Mesonia sp. K7]|uniref:imelysin family protein n=1 Tax=Mesonia sp. K7 TaxID=2218606 RepID=UPI000DA857FC|nr:imelysin family protein [Mesonia sp. K7]PZD79489.1 peptidase M75 superfamily protein [Mesonia sp. K7]